jgi:hypothetical protein
MDKRGSHIGIIISFAIFVVFLVFLYIVIEPIIKINKDKELILNYVKEELIRESSSELISASFKINDEVNLGGASCFSVNSSVSTTKKVGIITKNESNSVICSNISSPNYDIVYIGESNPSDKVYEVDYSLEFNNISIESSCVNLLQNCIRLVKDENYSIGFVKKGSYFFESKIIEVIKEYNSNYESLKTKFSIPKSSEFAFSFVTQENKELGTKFEETTTNIYSEKLPILYIDTEANLKSGFIVVKVW